MLLSEFFVIDKIGKKYNTIGFDHKPESGIIYFKNNQVLKIKPPQGFSEGEVLGSLLYIIEPDLYDFFLVMGNKKIYALPDKNFPVDVLEYIVNNRETVLKFKSFKLLINFIKF